MHKVAPTSPTHTRTTLDKNLECAHLQGYDAIVLGLSGLIEMALPTLTWDKDPEKNEKKAKEKPDEILNSPDRYRRYVCVVYVVVYINNLIVPFVTHFACIHVSCDDFHITRTCRTKVSASQGQRSSVPSDQRNTPKGGFPFDFSYFVNDANSKRTAPAHHSFRKLDTVVFLPQNLRSSTCATRRGPEIKNKKKKKNTFPFVD